MKELFYVIDLLGMALILVAVLLISFRDLLLYQKERRLLKAVKRQKDSEEDLLIANLFQVS